jgi:His-Xaa-Ser repeat protein HxsA
MERHLLIKGLAITTALSGFLKADSSSALENINAVKETNNQTNYEGTFFIEYAQPNQQMLLAAHRSHSSHSSHSSHYSSSQGYYSPSSSSSTSTSSTSTSSIKSDTGKSSTVATTKTAPSSSLSTSTELVKNIQKELIRKGYPIGTADGVLGSKTVSAIKLFQVENGLTPSGSPTNEIFTLLKSK